MIMLMLFSILAQAGLRDAGSEPGHHPLCRRGEMNACIRDHDNARQAELGAISAIDEKIQLLAKDQSPLSDSALALESEARSARITAEMARRENAAVADLSPSSPIFSGGPLPEELFFLRGEPNSWDEMHGEERRARLNSLAKSSLEKAAELEPQQRNLAMEIQALAAANAALQAERDQRGQQVRAHANMCESGCRMQFCPSD